MESQCTGALANSKISRGYQSSLHPMGQDESIRFFGGTYTQCIKVRYTYMDIKGLQANWTVGKSSSFQEKGRVADWTV